MVLDGCMPETITSNLPLVKWYAIPNDLLSNSGSKFVELVKAAIDHDFYVTTCINKRKLSSVSSNQERHPILIYGYDESDGSVFIMEYNQKERYGECTCSITELAMSYEQMGAQILWDDDTIVLVRRTPPSFYRTNLSKIRDLLEDYLHSQSSWWRFDCKYSHSSDDPTQGLNAYDRVLDYMQTISLSNRSLDVRIFCMIRDHKYVMNERIKYLERMGYIDPHMGLSKRYDSIYRVSEKMKLLALKYWMTLDLRLIGTLEMLISQMKTTEKIILEDILIQLNESCSMLSKYTAIPLDSFDSWVEVKHFPCCSVKKFAEGKYVTLKNGDSITAWDIIINDVDNPEESIYRRVSYKIGDVRGRGKIEVYFDMTGSPPISVIDLEECSEMTIKSADLFYTPPVSTQLLRSDIHYYVRGEENFSLDLYAVSLEKKYLF